MHTHSRKKTEQKRVYKYFFYRFINAVIKVTQLCACLYRGSARARFSFFLSVLLILFFCLLLSVCTFFIFSCFSFENWVDFLWDQLGQKKMSMMTVLIQKKRRKGCISNNIYTKMNNILITDENFFLLSQLVKHKFHSKCNVQFIIIHLIVFFLIHLSIMWTLLSMFMSVVVIFISIIFYIRFSCCCSYFLPLYWRVYIAVRVVVLRIVRNLKLTVNNGLKNSFLNKMCEKVSKNYKRSRKINIQWAIS